MRWYTCSAAAHFNYVEGNRFMNFEEAVKAGKLTEFYRSMKEIIDRVVAYHPGMPEGYHGADGIKTGNPDQ